ncbi:hypothetical protein MXB_1893, partial [Myxobolus squamalis]
NASYTPRWKKLMGNTQKLPVENFREHMKKNRNLKLDITEKTRYPEHYLMICKHFESQHTASIPGSQCAPERTVEDMVMRRFIHG